MNAYLLPLVYGWGRGLFRSDYSMHLPTDGIGCQHYWWRHYRVGCAVVGFSDFIPSCCHPHRSIGRSCLFLDWNTRMIVFECHLHQHPYYYLCCCYCYFGLRSDCCLQIFETDSLCEPIWCPPGPRSVSVIIWSWHGFFVAVIMHWLGPLLSSLGTLLCLNQLVHAFACHYLVAFTWLRNCSLLLWNLRETFS